MLKTVSNKNPTDLPDFGFLETFESSRRHWRMTHQTNSFLPAVVPLK